MAYKCIYSRAFLEKISTWPQPLRKMAFDAADHAALDPDLDDYKRPYLTPYRQKHPTTDHQYTLYFLVISNNELFFAWINDPSCLHETRANYPDPCRKEFEKLLGRNAIEKYDPQFHIFDFEVHPDRAKPIRCRSRFLGQETSLNTYPGNGRSFIGHAFHCDEQNPFITEWHVTLFLDKLHSELNTANLDFQFNLYKQGLQPEIDLLTKCYNPLQWQIVADPDDFILQKK